MIIFSADAVGGRARRQIGPKRHAERDQRAHIAARGRRIERHAGGVAQPVHGQKLGGGRHWTLDLEVHIGGRLMRRGVGHFEQARREYELAPGRQVRGGPVHRDLGVTSDNVDGKIGVMQRRQALHRRHHAIGGERIDGEAIIGQRRA
jgi:hypothetical protein